MKITIELLEKWGSCYSHERHVELSAGRECLSPLDIANMENIPAKDRLWVLLHNEIISEKNLRLLACDFAEYALTFVKNPDQRSIDAIAVSRKYADGNATSEELTAAREAASAASDAVSAASAASAAINAAKDAARYAAWAVSAAWAARAASDAMNAAILAARYATWAAREAAIQHFLQLIIKVLESEK